MPTIINAIKAAIKGKILESFLRNFKLLNKVITKKLPNIIKPTIPNGTNIASIILCAPWNITLFFAKYNDPDIAPPVPNNQKLGITEILREQTPHCFFTRFVQFS